MAVPNSSPRASAAVSVRNPQKLTLADRTFFLPGCCAVLWGCSSGPAGLAPEALEECVLLQGFFRSVVIVRGACFSQPRRCHAHVSTFACVRCILRRCGRASSPRAWACSRRSGRALRLVCTPFRHPFAGQEGEASMTPIERVANRGFLVELLSGDSSGRSCPIR
jgi:hypothetical protein